MPSTLTTADAALKEDYQPGVRNQLNDEVLMLAQCEKNSESFEGRRAVLSLMISRNSGVGARREAGTDSLPTAGNVGYAEERISTFRNYGRVQLTGPLIEGTRSDSGSFERQLKAEMDGITKALKRDINRQAWGTSDGVIATCGVTTASTLVVLAATTTAVQMRQFEVGGMLVDIGTLAQLLSGSGGRVYGASITAVDPVAKTITISSAITTAGTDFVSRAGSGGVQREITGAQTIVDSTGTLFNVNPATVPSWSSYEDSTGGQISESLVEKAIHTIHINSGEDPDLALSSDGVYRSYANTLLGLKSFTNSIELKGGHKALSITAGTSEIALTWERDCPANSLFLFNTKHLIEFVYSDWAWMDKDGAVLSRVANQDAYEATFRKYHELATDMRNSHGKLTGLTES